MARNAVRNITKLIFGILWHKVIIELCIRAKWFLQYILARTKGYKSHTHYMQTHLDLRIKLYEMRKGNFDYGKVFTD